MSKFIKRLLLFIIFPVIFVLVISLAVPATPRATLSLLFSKLDKDSLFENNPPPRLILIGGSNLAYGIDSSILEEGLGIKTINSSIHISLGAKYMLDTSLEHIKAGDVVVIALEYQQYFGADMYGGQELLRMVLDVDRSSIELLNFKQWLNIVKYLPEYSISKIKPSQYNFKQDPYVGIYERTSFNEYGDAYIHWTRNPKPVKTFEQPEGSFSSELIDYILAYEQKLEKLGAKLYLTFPALHTDSYTSLEQQILKVEQELQRSGLKILGNSKRYRFPADLFFDSPYHLTYEGVEIRTRYLLEDIFEEGLVGAE